MAQSPEALWCGAVHKLGAYTLAGDGTRLYIHPTSAFTFFSFHFLIRTHFRPWQILQHRDIMCKKMKIRQALTSIRILGLLFGLIGLTVSLLIIVKVVIEPKCLLNFTTYSTSFLAVVFILIGLSCFCSDYIVVNDFDIAYYRNHFYRYEKRSISREEIVGFELIHGLIKGRRKSREGKVIVLRLQDGETITVRDVDTAHAQEKLLKKINTVWKH